MSSSKKTHTKKASGKKKAHKRKVEAVPELYGTVTPHLIVSPCAEAIELYKRAFGAKTLMVMDAGGVVMHAEIKIGDSVVMLSDEMPAMPGRASNRKTPKTVGATTGGVMLYVKNVDKWFQRAIEAGCTPSMPVTDMFWGDRYGQLEDPFGHIWAIATHTKDLTPKEMKAAMAYAGPPTGE